MVTRCYIGGYEQTDRLKKLKKLKMQNQNRIVNFFQIVDEMALQRGKVCSMPLVLTENGLIEIQTSIKSSLFKHIDWKNQEGFSEDYAVQCAINNGLHRVNSWTY